MSLIDINSDIKGDAFEYFLSKYTATHNTDLGEYFTPRHIVKTCVKLANPQIGEKIYDPFCGTGGMLIEGFKHIANSMANTERNWLELRQNTIYGNEITENARITKMNMILMGDGHNNIQRCDSLRGSVENKYDVVITNMPFALPVDDETSSLYTLPSSDGNSICLQHCLRSLKEGGRLVIVVPDGLISNKKYKQLRKWVLSICEIQSIVALPPGMFAPYSQTAKANIIYLIKSRHQRRDSFWHFTVRQGSHSHTSSQTKGSIGKEDLDIFMVHRSDHEHSLFSKVHMQEVIKNNYSWLPERGSNSNTQYDVSLGDVCFEVNDKAGVEYVEYERMSLSNKKGFVPKMDFYKRESQQTQTKKPEAYKKVYPKHFAYRVTEGLSIGTIDYNRSEDTYLVSPIYPVFRIDESRINHEYLYRILTSQRFKDMAQGMLKGTARPSIPFKDFCKIRVPIPPLTIQEVMTAQTYRHQELIDEAQKIDQQINKQINSIWSS